MPSGCRAMDSIVPGQVGQKVRPLVFNRKGRKIQRYHKRRWPADCRRGAAAAPVVPAFSQTEGRFFCADRGTVLLSCPGILPMMDLRFSTPSRSALDFLWTGTGDGSLPLHGQGDGSFVLSETLSLMNYGSLPRPDLP